jgi:SpoVK/Ycf46/Vps4 family AAA+-type ATPase
VTKKKVKESPKGTAYDDLEKMIGLDEVKKVIHQALDYYKAQKLFSDKGIQQDSPSMHMVFTGNPGTAKTTVARLFAEILKDEKVLPTGVFVEVGRADLVGDHVGSTAPLVKKKFREAQGGVLFIDEAYSLCDRYSNGFGDEAINTLVQEMENHRDNVIVIFAGYPEPMKQFLERNPGMQSRIAFQVGFDDYDTDELCRITRLMITKKRMSITNAAMNKLLIIYDNARKEEDYGNGRFVRSIIEEAEMNLAERIMKLKESEITTELITTIEECDIPVHAAQKRKKLDRIGFAVKDYERGMI